MVDFLHIWTFADSWLKRFLTTLMWVWGVGDKSSMKYCMESSEDT